MNSPTKTSALPVFLANNELTRRCAPTRRCVIVCQSNQQQMLQNKRAVLAGLAVLCLATAGCEAKAAACPNFASANNGLQYCDEVVGEGGSPVKGAMIRAHYTGRLASNGKVFDSSLERGKPLSFKIGVGQVIQGWDFGILGNDEIPAMREGGKRKLIIPSDLAYGERGAGGVIPPGATLEFDVQLLPPRSR